MSVWVLRGPWWSLEVLTGGLIKVLRVLKGVLDGPQGACPRGSLGVLRGVSEFLFLNSFLKIQ